MTAKFWVGGTGTWDNTDDTHWSLTTGGANNTTHPTSADTATLDASSGGGTVTVNANLDITTLTMSAFTGTLDFAANDNNITLQTFVNNGSGTRTLNMGDGTWTVTGTTATVWNQGTTTNLTFAPGASTILLTGNVAALRTFSPGNLAYNIISIGANTSAGSISFGTNTVTSTIATLNVAAPNSFSFAGGSTVVITNAFNFVGTPGLPIEVYNTAPQLTATVSTASGSPTMSWAYIRGMTFSGGATFMATNSLNGGSNSGITITPPILGIVGG